MDALLITALAMVVLYLSTLSGLNKIENFQLESAFLTVKTIINDKAGELPADIINNDFLNELKMLSGSELSVINKEGILASTVTWQLLRPKDIRDIYNEIAHKQFGRLKIYKPNYQLAFIYSALNDNEGRPIAVLEIIRPRQAIIIFRKFFLKIAVITFIFVILTIAITVLFITGIILKPLNMLNKAIAEIQRTKDLLKRVKVESRDEIGILAADFNTMMDALNKSQNELVTTQQNLVNSERLSTAAEFAMGTVHQINNPLSIVINRTQLLRRLINYKTDIPEADLERDLNIIEAQTKRAVDITSSLLHYAKPSSFRFERCNINELLEETVSLFAESFLETNIKVAKHLKADLPPVEYCDVQQMQDVFMNIITNAQQAMQGGGALKIGSDYNKEEDMVCIRFTDNGYGIAPGNIKKLFTPFFSTKADQRGMGLAMSYNIVKGHFGKIEVESEEGRGTTFTIKLPLWRMKYEDTRSG